jgi:hypothetical protein
MQKNPRKTIDSRIIFWVIAFFFALFFELLVISIYHIFLLGALAGIGLATVGDFIGGFGKPSPLFSWIEQKFSTKCQS